MQTSKTALRATLMLIFALTGSDVATRGKDGGLVGRLDILGGIGVGGTLIFSADRLLDISPKLSAMDSKILNN